MFSRPRIIPRNWRRCCESNTHSASVFHYHDVIRFPLQHFHWLFYNTKETFSEYDWLLLPSAMQCIQHPSNIDLPFSMIFIRIYPPICTMLWDFSTVYRITRISTLNLKHSSDCSSFGCLYKLVNIMHVSNMNVMNIILPFVQLPIDTHLHGTGC